MNRLPFAAALIGSLALALSGCTRLQVALPQVHDKQAENAKQVAALLHYYRLTASYSREDLDLELSGLNRELVAGRCSTFRLKAALLLNHRSDSKKTAERELSLLKPCVANDPYLETPQAELALLLSNVATQKARLMDDQAKRMKTLTKELAATRQTAQSLQKKLNALKEIEQSIHDRNQPNPASSKVSNGAKKTHSDSR